MCSSVFGFQTSVRSYYNGCIQNLRLLTCATDFRDIIGDFNLCSKIERSLMIAEEILAYYNTNFSHKMTPELENIGNSEITDSCIF